MRICEVTLKPTYSSNKLWSTDKIGKVHEINIANNQSHILNSMTVYRTYSVCLQVSLKKTFKLLQKRIAINRNVKEITYIKKG